MINAGQASSGNVVQLPNYNTVGISNFPFYTVGDVVTKGLLYAYTFAGVILLVLLIWGGITLMTAAGDPNKVKSGYGTVTAGLIGFGLIFISYIVLQVVQVILNAKII
ncbi:MAG TPA: hypothetical protein VF828_03340 [Patescibacteria group bacterium]